jgi:hypothetical protein
MPVVRLTDSQKHELLGRFRGGEGLQPLADAYGCSANTVSRVVKAGLEPGEYERLKAQRTRRASKPELGSAHSLLQPEAIGADLQLQIEPAQSSPGQPASSVLPGRADPKPSQDLELTQDLDPPPPAESARIQTSPPAFAAPSPTFECEPTPAAPMTSQPRAQSTPQPPPAEGDPEGPGLLAIDDADDFGGDEADDESDAGADEDEDLDFDPDADFAAPGAFVPIPLLEMVDDHIELRPLPLTAAEFSGSAWMLVDKTVELQAKPLSDFPELGRLPAEEQERQALLVFINPRQAKRQCGRTQRVIKIPDPAVFELTAPYLLAQGISRLVIEGALFALPGS